MVLRSSDREKPLPGARINLGPTPTATTSSTGETKAGRRGRILHLGPPDPAPIPPPRRPDPRSTLAKQRERKPPPPRTPAPSRTAAAPAPTAPKVAATSPPAPKVRHRFNLPAFSGQVRQIEALRTRLRREIEEHERQIREAERGLERRDWPVIGLLTRRSQEALEEQLSTLVDNLDAVYSQLLDAAVEADFDIDARAQALFAELTRRFDGLRPVASAQDSAGTARRAAAPRDDQIQNRLTQPALDLITSPLRPLRLHHGREKELFIFPWFVAVIGRVGGCGLHDIRDLFVSMRAAATGVTGELLVTLPTGFDEAYRFSSAAACDAFVDAFAAYLDALPPPAPVIATPTADRRPPSGAQPPVPTPPVAAAGQPQVPDTRPTPPALKLASVSPAAAPSSSREAAVASTATPPATARPIPAEIRLIPLPRGLLPAADDPFAAPQARTENAAAASSAPAPVSPTVEAPAPLAANASNEPASAVVPTAATEAPAPAPEIPAPAPAIDVATPTAREAEANATVEIVPPLDAVATTSAPAAMSPAAEAETPVESRAPDVGPTAEQDAAHPPIEGAAMVPTAPVSPVVEQTAEVAPPPPTPDVNLTVDAHQPTFDAATIAPASDSPAIEPIALAVPPDTPTVPTPDVSPVVEQDTLPLTRDSAAPSMGPPEDAVPATLPAGHAADRPHESAAPNDDLRPAPDAALPPISIRWDTAVPLAPAASPPGAPQRDDPVRPPVSLRATPARPWREPNADDSAAHWSEPLSRLHIPVWPPIESPPASHRTPLDDEAVQHWSEPVSLIQVPAWPPLDGSPASTAKLPRGASIKLSAAARSAVDAVVASSRAHLHTSARVGAAGLAAVTTYIDDVRTSVANRRQQRQVAPADPPSVRIRPSVLSVPRPLTSLLGNRTWRWVAALTVLAIAIAATSPFLWRQHSEPTVAASSPPPLPPLPPSPPAPGSAPAAPALPAAAAPQPKAEIPSPPRPAPRESRPLSGVEVAQLQGRLRALGFNPGPADGVIGPRTVTAAREFQAAHGLTITGTIDSALFDDVSVAQAKTMKPPGAP